MRMVKVGAVEWLAPEAQLAPEVRLAPAEWPAWVAEVTGALAAGQ
jgi:hypothetical protein